jgi:choline dehydrogenase-like flavoprotein
MVIVVGSGAGGATVAKELAVTGLPPVLLLEKGPDVADKDAYKHYDGYAKKDIRKQISINGGIVFEITKNTRTVKPKRKTP